MITARDECFCLMGGLSNDRLQKIERNGTHTYHNCSAS